MSSQSCANECARQVDTGRLEMQQTDWYCAKSTRCICIKLSRVITLTMLSARMHAT